MRSLENLSASVKKVIQARDVINVRRFIMAIRFRFKVDVENAIVMIMWIEVIQTRVIR
jgi:hypothetical protein